MNNKIQSVDEAINIVNWIGSNVQDLDAMDQIVVMAALLEMAESVRPIYLKHLCTDESSSFLMKI